MQIISSIKYYKSSYGKKYNKIIILGNGFDLHLGLPTKWSDFIEFYEIIVNGSFEKFRFIEFQH